MPGKNKIVSVFTYEELEATTLSHVDIVDTREIETSIINGMHR